MRAQAFQNAVDAGALNVRFQVRHDGRRFNVLDVLRLSFVGLLTKGEGQKRTIGFMGIGIKTVYKRFHEFWRFSFEELLQQGKSRGVPATGTFGWVIQP